MMITTIAVFFSFFHSVGANSETPLDTSEVNEFLSSLKKRFHSIQTYKCKMILESFEGDHKIQNQRLWYKKPGYVRIEQTGPFKKGAVVVIHPNAKIWGHLGGALSIFKAELEPENPILMGVTKDSAVTADYGSILEAAMDRATRVVKYEITQAEESGKPVMILDFFLMR